MMFTKRFKTDQEKYDSTCHWHLWYAWYPVLTPRGWEWLVKVERRRVLVGGHETFFAWRYR